jgi:hypothetical protein
MEDIKYTIFLFPVIFRLSSGCAADIYPFMVLTAALLDRDKFTGRLSEMLSTETKLTSGIGALPDTWSFPKKGMTISILRGETLKMIIRSLSGN